MVRCFDGCKRLCRIMGNIRLRTWIRVNDMVLVYLRHLQTDKRGDMSTVTRETRESGWGTMATYRMIFRIYGGVAPIGRIIKDLWRTKQRCPGGKSNSHEGLPESIVLIGGNYALDEGEYLERQRVVCGERITLFIWLWKVNFISKVLWGYGCYGLDLWEMRGHRWG